MELERMRELCRPGFICKLPPDLNNSRGVEKPHRPHTDWRNEQSIASPCWQRINHKINNQI